MKDVLAKDGRDIILAPVVSEKSYAMSDLDRPVYTFVVAPGSNKAEIKDAIQSIFGVTVTKVNTLNRKGKRKLNRRNNKWGKRPDSKRAMVTLAEGDSIELFEV